MADPAVKVSGDVKGGFIVEMHDGARFLSFTCAAASEADAEKAALDAWDDETAQTKAAVSALTAHPVIAPVKVVERTPLQASVQSAMAKGETAAEAIATGTPIHPTVHASETELRLMAEQVKVDNPELAAELTAQADKIAAEKPHG